MLPKKQYGLSVSSFSTVIMGMGKGSEQIEGNKTITRIGPFSFFCRVLVSGGPFFFYEGVWVRLIPFPFGGGGEWAVSVFCTVPSPLL